MNPWTDQRADLLADLTSALDLRAGLAQILGNDPPASRSSEPFVAENAELMADLSTTLHLPKGLATIRNEQGEYTGLLANLTATVDAARGLAEIIAPAVRNTGANVTSSGGTADETNSPDDEAGRQSRILEAQEQHRLPPRSAATDTGTGDGTASARLTDRISGRQPAHLRGGAMSPGAGTPPPDIRGYRYLRDLGIGGFSSVYLYLQESTDRKVAVKVLRVGGSDAADEALAEAKLMAKFEHQPNIVQIYEASRTQDGQPYIIMSYCAGADLWTQVRRGPLPVARVVRIGVQVADAVHTAHSFDVVHRDIKPANILTDENDVPRLTDFGGAGRLRAIDDTDTGYSLPWTPPEILDGEPATRASDVYSLGATLWSLLAGHSPFETSGDNRADSMARRIRAGKTSRLGRTDLPADLEDLLRRMLARKPSDRPGSARIVARELDAIESRLEPEPGLRQPMLVGHRPLPLDQTADRPRYTPPEPAKVVPVESATVHKGRRGSLDQTNRRVRRVDASAESPAHGRSRKWLIAMVLVTSLAIGVIWGLTSLH